MKKEEYDIAFRARADNCYCFVLRHQSLNDIPTISVSANNRHYDVLSITFSGTINDLAELL